MVLGRRAPRLLVQVLAASSLLVCAAPRASAAAGSKPPATGAARPATSAPVPAAAAKGPSTASEWFEKGSIHHKLGEFTEAIACYREAYRLNPDPTYFYNMALAYRQLGKYSEALRYYEMVLVDDPTTPLRPTIEKSIVELRRLKAAKPEVPEDPIDPSPGMGSGAGGTGAAGPATSPALGAGSAGPGTPAPPARRGLPWLTIGLAAGGGVIAAGVAILVTAIVVAGPSPAAYARGFPGRIYDFTERP